MRAFLLPPTQAFVILRLSATMGVKMYFARLAVATMLLRLFFFIEIRLIRNVREAVYIRLWPLYDWIFDAAMLVLPFDVPAYKDIKYDK